MASSIRPRSPWEASVCAARGSPGEAGVGGMIHAIAQLPKVLPSVAQRDPSLGSKTEMPVPASMEPGIAGVSRSQHRVFGKSAVGWVYRDGADFVPGNTSGYLSTWRRRRSISNARHNIVLREIFFAGSH